MNPSDRIDDLLKRYQQGTVTEQQREAIDRWLEQYPETDLYAQLPDAERTAMLHEVMNYVNGQIAVRQKRRRLQAAVFRAAAAIALLMTASVLVWQWQRVEILSVQTAAQTEKVILPDGTIIWLKQNSTLQYPEKFNSKTRNVSFTGEALFEVEKDAEHPFVISCGNLTATVLGTSFTMKATPASIEVLVLTGKVALEGTTTNQKIIVLPSEKAVFKKADEHLAKNEAPPAEVVQAIAHPEYDMKFNDTRMDEIMRRMETKFNVSITVENEAVNNCLLTADLTDQSLTSSLDKITKVFAMRYERNGNTITLTGGQGCNN